MSKTVEKGPCEHVRIKNPHNLLSFLHKLLHYINPTINHLHQADYKYPPEHVVLNEDYKEGEWVYLAISGDGNGTHETSWGAHPVY